MEYELIYSDRKTLALQIKQGRLIVRAPRRASKKEIDAFLRKNSAWIEANLAKARAQQERAAAVPRLSPEEISQLAQKAVQLIPERVAHYARLLGVSYGNITIRLQKTRWGSCSSQGNLNFNCLLMLAPKEVLDSVVAHELCHRKEMNHSDRFYAELLRICPDYYECRRWLKENGPRLMAMAGK